MGLEGMGKTWVVADWLQSNLERLPIVVLAPSASLETTISGRTEIVAFLAHCLRELDQTSYKDESFWEIRVNRLLSRPKSDGPVLILFFDGMNEKPSFLWRELLNHLQNEEFEGRIQVIATSRSSFIQDRMHDLREWAWNPVRIEVGPYDDSLGGEFDQRLAASNLTRDDLPESLVEFARVPRLFDLVVTLRDRLGDVGSVTVPRLFWAYGRAAATSRAFSEDGWRRFVLNEAKEFMEGRKSQSPDLVADLSSDRTTPTDDVYKRVSLISDGVFAQTGDWGDIEFEDVFVRYALGLALVRELEQKSRSESQEALEQFVEILSEHDEKAEILRAAVSIALEKSATTLLGVLCTEWVQCQNFPEVHFDELAQLAKELVEPLLDAIEKTSGQVASSPRYRAVNALDNVDHDDRLVATTIANRAARWFSWISQERRTTATQSDDESFDVLRKHLLSRIGTADLGRLVVLGREIEIMPHVDTGLRVAAVQLLQGRPLAGAIDFFEAGALLLAIRGSCGDEEAWLNDLNDIDAAETAAELRARSESMLRRRPEQGVHQRLNERVAAILLWRTGYSIDAENARQIDPGLDRFKDYAEDYEKDPAKSFYPIERRHVVETLERTELTLHARIQRTMRYLLDPSIVVPTGFVEEAIHMAQTFQWDQLNVGKSETMHDRDWRDLTLVLARCAPRELANLERRRIQSFAGRNGEARYGAALVAPNLMLLIGDVERDTLRELRERREADPDDMEEFTKTWFLIAELLEEPTIDQVHRILDAQLDGVDGTLAQICSTASTSELESIVDEFRDDPCALKTIAEIMQEKPIKLGAPAFQVFAELLDRDAEPEDLSAVWMVLGQGAPERLGRILDRNEWTWSSDLSPAENVMGSFAIAAVNQDSPFEQFATRLAPLTLLHVVANRGSKDHEVACAVELLSHVVLQSSIALPETLVAITHDRSAAEVSKNYLFSYGDIQENRNTQDVRLTLLLNQANREERRHTLAREYFEKVMKARRDGASFHLEYVHPEHLRMVISSCPDVLEIWLNGMNERTEDFENRVRLADGLFISLCETLLMEKPGLGVELWHALKEIFTHVKFAFRDDMDRMLDAIFAAAPHQSVDQALDDLYELQESHTDRDLIEIVVAARCHDRMTWLSKKVSDDAKALCPLNQRRASFLRHVLTVPEIATEDEWPVGEFGDVERGTSWKLGQRETFAQHWFRTFVCADSEIEAHAAWQLFLASVDRRVWSWWADILDYEERERSTLDDIKMRFVAQQKRDIYRAIRENEKDWEKTFTLKRYPRALRPWSQ